LAVLAVLNDGGNEAILVVFKVIQKGHVTGILPLVRPCFGIDWNDAGDFPPILCRC
jgi:hypothetical protein